MAKAMQARYKTQCANHCGAMIQVGQDILFDGKARHATCEKITAYDRGKAQVDAVTAAVDAGHPLALILDGLREDETLDQTQLPALSAYARWACAHRDADTSREERIANGECPGNLAEESLFYSEASYDTRQQAIEACA